MDAPREQCIIPVGSPATNTAAAVAYCAVLAFPGDPDKRNRFSDECLAWLAREWAAGDAQKRARIPQSLRDIPTQRIYESGSISMALKWLPRRLLIAEHLAAMLINNSPPCGPWKFTAAVDGVAVDNVHGIAKAIGAKYPNIGLPKAYSRWWRPTKPVLHLAFILNAVLLEDGDRYKFEGKPDLLSLFIHPEWVEKALGQTEAWRKALISWPKLNLKSHETISVRGS